MNQLCSPLLQTSSPASGKVYAVFSTTRLSADVLSIGVKQCGAKYTKLVLRYLSNELILYYSENSDNKNVFHTIKFLIYMIFGNINLFCCKIILPAV